MLLQYGPHFFSTLSEKFGQLARFFWANGLPPPLAKNFPYAYGFASEQNEENPAGKELPAFFSEEKQPPSVTFLWNNEDSYFFHS